MSTKIQASINFMKANLYRKLTLDEIAQVVKLSRSRLCHLVKFETGMTCGQCLKMLRMEKACELLRNTSLSIKEIMANVGMRDKSHFARDFKIFYGLTPSEYRQQPTVEKPPGMMRQGKTVKSANK